MVEVSASILNIKNENVIQTLYNLESSGIDHFHIDVMDGKFVKNNTSSKMIEYCEYLNNISNMPLDVHLMVQDVENYIKSFLTFEPNIITVHLEAAKDKKEIMNWINFIKQNNVKVGVSIKPNTKIEEIYKYLPFVHLILIMTVEPGEGGQELIPETIEKIQKLNKYIQKNNLEVDIQVDGGINTKNVNLLKKAGANIIVAGTAIINSNNYKNIVQTLKA